jgi:hypothetical protein
MNSTTTPLIRKFVTGYKELEARWVNAHLDSAAIPGCSTKKRFFWTYGTREYRFCPLTGIDTSKVPAYKGTLDSLRIYKMASQVLDTEYIYTPKPTRAMITRDQTAFEFAIIKKIVDSTNTNAPRNIILTQPTGRKDTLVEVKPVPLTKWGETGKLPDGVTLIHETIDIKKTVADSIWRIKILKYMGTGGLMYVYPTPVNSTSKVTRVRLYDSLLMGEDSARADYWKTLYKCKFAVDSFVLNGYDTTTKTATSVSHKTGRFFDDGAWVLAVCSLVIYGKPTAPDTFVYRDTTQVKHWNYHWDQAGGGIPPVGLRNLIDTALCPIGVETAEAYKPKFMLVQNYPNPFNPSTMVRFAIPAQQKGTHYTLCIYDVRGQLVRTLAKGSVGAAGLSKQVLWEGSDNLGRPVSAGMYFYRLTAGNQVKKGGMVMVK